MSEMWPKVTRHPLLLLTSFIALFALHFIYRKKDSPSEYSVTDTEMEESTEFLTVIIRLDAKYFEAI